jgi:hypothetical protein
MSTAIRGSIESSPPRSWTTVLGQLSAAALIVAPLLAMLVPELNHRLGSTPSKGRSAVSAAASSAASAELNPFAVKRSDL